MKIEASPCNEMLKLNRNMKQTVMSRLQDSRLSFPTKTETLYLVKLLDWNRIAITDIELYYGNESTSLKVFRVSRKHS